MSDSFNPQEILSRLRGNKNPGNTNPNPHQNANSSLSQPQSSQVNANITQNSKSISLNTNKTMKTPASLTLTPSQVSSNQLLFSKSILFSTFIKETRQFSHSN